MREFSLISYHTGCIKKNGLTPWQTYPILDHFHSNYKYFDILILIVPYSFLHELLQGDVSQFAMVIYFLKFTNTFWSLYILEKWYLYKQCSYCHIFSREIFLRLKGVPKSCYGNLKFQKLWVPRGSAKCAKKFWKKF